MLQVAFIGGLIVMMIMFAIDEYKNFWYEFRR